MKAIVYQIQISESPLHGIHGFSKYIDEVYFPELGLFVNDSTCFTNSKKDASRRLEAAKDDRIIEVDMDEDLRRLVSLSEEYDQLKSKIQLALLKLRKTGETLL